MLADAKMVHRRQLQTWPGHIRRLKSSQPGKSLGARLVEGTAPTAPHEVRLFLQCLCSGSTSILQHAGTVTRAVTRRKGATPGSADSDENAVDGKVDYSIPGDLTRPDGLAPSWDFHAMRARRKWLARSWLWRGFILGVPKPRLSPVPEFRASCRGRSLPQPSRQPLSVSLLLDNGRVSLTCNLRRRAILFPWQTWLASEDIFLKMYK